MRCFDFLCSYNEHNNSYFVMNGKNEGFLPARGRKNNPESPAQAPRLEINFSPRGLAKITRDFSMSLRTLFFPIASKKTDCRRSGQKNSLLCPPWRAEKRSFMPAAYKVRTCVLSSKKNRVFYPPMGGHRMKKTVLFLRDGKKSFFSLRKKKDFFFHSAIT